MNSVLQACRRRTNKHLTIGLHHLHPRKHGEQSVPGAPSLSPWRNLQTFVLSCFPPLGKPPSSGSIELVKHGKSTLLNELEMINSWFSALVLLVRGFRCRYHMVAIFTLSGTYGHLQIGGSPSIPSLLAPGWYFPCPRKAAFTRSPDVCFFKKPTYSVREIIFNQPDLVSRQMTPHTARRQSRQRLAERI